MGHWRYSGGVACSRITAAGISSLIMASFAQLQVPLCASLPGSLRFLPIGVGIGVLDHFDHSLFWVHAFVPGLLAHLRSRVVNGLADGLPCPGEVNAEETVVVLHDPAIDHYRMHVSAPGLIHDVTVGVEQREHYRRVVILNQNEIGLFAWCDTTDEAVHTQRLSAAKRCPGYDLLGTQMAEHDGYVALVRLQVLTTTVGVQGCTHGGEEIGTPPDTGVHGEGDGDVMPPELPGGWVALTGVLLAFG